MCLGKAPSCGVHSLLIRHYRPLRAPAVHGFDWYAPGCHACDALADEYGAPKALDASITWNGERPTPDQIATLRAEHKPEGLDAGPLGSGHSPSVDTVSEREDSGGSVEDPSTHLIHGPASAHKPGDPS